MSEYLLVETEMDEGEAIKAALKEMGYVFEEHKEAQNLYGFRGDKRKQKAHIIVRRQHVGSAANDVGFVKDADGKYELIISQFDRGTGQKQGQDFMKNIKQIYGKHSVLIKSKRLGLTFRNQKTDGGKIKIKCSYMGP